MVCIVSWQGLPESAVVMVPWPLDGMQQCLCRWLIQDTLKVLTYKLLYAFDIFQIRSGSFTGKDGHGPGSESLLGIHVRHNPSSMFNSSTLYLSTPCLVFVPALVRAVVLLCI